MCLIFLAVKMYFFLNDRLIAYDIIDNGTHRPYRLRYSQALARGNTPVFTGGGFLDVPTDDTPVTGRRLGRNIYIWYENSLISHSSRSCGVFKFAGIYAEAYAEAAICAKKVAKTSM